MVKLIAFLSALSLPSFAAPALTETHDFALRSFDPLRISNLRGAVQLKGWALDKVRVEVSKSLLRKLPAEESERLLRSVQVRFEQVNGSHELAVEYGRGMELADRLRERAMPSVAAAIRVWAPAHLLAQVTVVGGAVRVQEWAGPLELSSVNGPFEVSGVRLSGTRRAITAQCSACSVKISDTRASLRVISGSGAVSLFGVQGASVFVETTSGQIRTVRTVGEQSYVTGAGSIFGQDLRGAIEVHSDSGQVEILDSAGSVSGSCTTCNFIGTFRSWEFSDKAIFESLGGAIQLALPSDFSGELRVLSQGSPAEIDGFWSAREMPAVSGSRRFRGESEGETLQLIARRGKIQVSKYVGASRHSTNSR